MSDPIYHSRHARWREAEYVAHFQHLFHNGLAISHPTTGERIQLENWSLVERVEDDLLQVQQYLNLSALASEQQLNYPKNMRLAYWIEPNSLGGILKKYPREGFVIECATLSRLERLVNTGQDAERLHLATLEEVLQERAGLIQRWSMRYGLPIAHLLGLAATTGWDEESIERIWHYVSARNAPTVPYLIDLLDLTVYSTATYSKQSEYQTLFERSLGERKLSRIRQQIQAALLTRRAMRFADLQRQLGCSVALIEEACVQLVTTTLDYRILPDGHSWVIRNDC